jgi:prevent-host-death family protein
MKTMTASKFKATCLAVMDEVEAKRESVLITKNGKPVAKLEPLDLEGDPLAVFRFGKGRIVGDIVSPITPTEDWEAQ